MKKKKQKKKLYYSESRPHHVMSQNCADGSEEMIQKNTMI